MRLTSLIAAGVGLVFAAGQATAGELHFYNWGNYTDPKVLEKFTAETGIDITLDGYDSNDMMLAKVKAGGSGYDLAVPSGFMVKIMTDEGLIQKAGVNQMANFKNVEDQWVDVYFDPGREYSVPWQWGSTGISLNTKYYDGPKSDSWAWFLIHQKS